MRHIDHMITLPPALRAPVFFVVCFLLGSCAESSDPVSSDNPPLMSEVARSGQYTWIDRTDPVNPVIQFQFASLRFFENLNGELKFTLRVDMSVENPARRFNDLTAIFTQKGDSVFITDPIIIQQGQSDNIPLGGFELFPSVDSLILNRVVPPNTQDTTMRISMFIGTK